MGADQFPPAQGAEHPEQPRRPRRVWDGRSWIEAMTIRRSGDGTFVSKDGREPLSQLDLPWADPEPN